MHTWIPPRAAAVSSLAWQARLSADLGGETSFRVRAKFERKHAFRSLTYDSITVTKV